MFLEHDKVGQCNFMSNFILICGYVIGSNADNMSNQIKVDPISSGTLHDLNGQCRHNNKLVLCCA